MNLGEVKAVTRYLTPELAEAAYSRGIFPMGYHDMELITWHQPDPRAVIPLDKFHLSKSMRKTLRQGVFEITYDKDFTGVMQGCSERDQTWITPDFKRVYAELHSRGKAHSVEVWHEGALVGGTYGVQIGGAFFAESKFHRVTDASKAALAGLVQRLSSRGFTLLEVQYVTPHLARFGAVSITNAEYQTRLQVALKMACSF